MKHSFLSLPGYLEKMILAKDDTASTRTFHDRPTVIKNQRLKTTLAIGKIHVLIRVDNTLNLDGTFAIRFDRVPFCYNALAAFASY